MNTRTRINPKLLLSLLCLAGLIPTPGQASSLIELESPVPVVVIEKQVDGSHAQARVAELNPKTNTLEPKSEPFIVDTEVFLELNYRQDFHAVAGGMALFLITRDGQDFETESGIMLRLGMSRGFYMSAGFAKIGILGAEIAAEYAYDAIQTQSKLGLTARFNILYLQGIIGSHYEFINKDVTTFMGVGVILPLNMITNP